MIYFSNILHNKSLFWLWFEVWLPEKIAEFKATGSKIYQGNVPEQAKEHHLFSLIFIQVRSFF
jgi:hypothetical protein